MKLLGQLRRTCEQLRMVGGDDPFPRRLLSHLEITCRIADRDLESIPRQGAVVVVVNHPFGLLDAAVLAAILPGVRKDVRFLANYLLSEVPEIRDLLIPVDPFARSESPRRNQAPVRRALEHLGAGGLLVVFPAGAVSHFQWRERVVTDPPWPPILSRILSRAARRTPGLRLVPCYIEGANSALFHFAGMIHPHLRTLLLGRELLNKRGRTVEVRIGTAIPYGRLSAMPTDAERTDYLRWRTYLLSDRRDHKPRTRLPLLGRRVTTPAPLAELVPAARLAENVRALDRCCRLAQSGELEVYLAPARMLPDIMPELGRLRELSFRAVGEGTGKSADLDEFDNHYLHLFVWHSTRREIVGAYRLAPADIVRAAHGLRGLYTATLFRYREEFLDKLGPALELGRSFVRPEYQCAFAPLLLLWKGIGRYIAENPRYQVLFGPVSISNRYRPVSRRLMVSFLERFAWQPDLAAMVAARNPFRSAEPFAGFDLDDLSEAVADVEPTRQGVPILLRQYLKLGGKLLAFNVDHDFNGAVDGLILVDLAKAEPKLVERYLGKTEAAMFFAFHEGAYETIH